LVRRYSADGTLYAYEDGDERVVVSRGNEPTTRWTDREPATRTEVAAGDQFWTVPENWNLVAKESQDSIAYGIYEVEESGAMVKLSIPTNNWLVDAWYGVKEVGDSITADIVGELADAGEVRELADVLEQSEHDHHDEPSALRRVADNWDVMERELSASEEYVADEWLAEERRAGQPVPTDDWTIETMHPMFRPSEAIRAAADLSDLDTNVSHAVDALQAENLLPRRYQFRLSIAGE